MNRHMPSPGMLGNVRPITSGKLQMSPSGNLKSRICNICGKGFSSRSGYMNHMNSHRGVFRFTCSECGKGFSCTKNLKQHLSGHTGINYFNCERCSESFRYYEQLQHHQASCGGTGHTNVTNLTGLHQTGNGSKEAAVTSE